MAYKQNIPDAWKRMRPNTAKLPFIYNLDAAVGAGSPNQRLDVMMVQYFLQNWRINKGETVHRVNPNAVPQRPLPATGAFDNRTLAWIFWYQLTNFADTSSITGKVTPAAQDGSDLTGRHTLLHLELQLLDPDANGKTFTSDNSKMFLDLSTDPTAPRELVAALAKPR
jgi:hypothetical protein